MIFSSLSRQALLMLSAAIFVANAVQTIVSPDEWAAGLGLSLRSPNGYSEVYAVYVGIWLATAFLCALAAVRVRQSLLGDLAAMFVLSQAAGRVLALFQFGPPEGTLLLLFALEAAGGVGLFVVRPSSAAKA